MTSGTPRRAEAELRAATVGPLKKLAGKIKLAAYDPKWPRLYEREAERIRAALGPRALRVEHVGSTSVPGLTAKPVIDILLAVADAGVEADYVPALEAKGYRLRIREPDWFDHRVLKGPDTSVNLHVFSRGCVEIKRMLAFRDRLRTHPADRARYAATKRRLSRRDWEFTQHYADAKSSVVEAILKRANPKRPTRPRRGRGAGSRAASRTA